MNNDTDWAYERALSRCRCGGDMPGRCPGPAYCPCCEDDGDSEEETE